MAKLVQTELHGKMWVQVQCSCIRYGIENLFGLSAFEGYFKRTLCCKGYYYKNIHTHTHVHTHIHTHAHSQAHVFDMEAKGQAKYWTKIGIFQAEWESVQGGQRVLKLLYFADIWIRNMDDWCKWLNIGNRNHLVVQLTSARRKVVRNLPSLVHLTPLAFAAKENLRKHCASNQH